MKRTFLTLFVSLFGVATFAQAPASKDDANPFSQTLRTSWNNIKRNVSESAAKMPEADYSFRPTKEVRSFGELVGHLANDNYLICAETTGEKNPNSVDFEKKTTKANLVKALSDSVAYCDALYNTMTDAKAIETTMAFGRQARRAEGLTLNVTHNSEHYGNMVTYLRLRGLVPPSTARTQR